MDPKKSSKTITTKGDGIQRGFPRTGFSQDPVTKRGGCGTRTKKLPRKRRGQVSKKGVGPQDDDFLPTAEEIKAMHRGRVTKLSRGDSEMDGPYERRNE